MISALAATSPVAQYAAMLRPGAAAGNTESANVHALRPMARRQEMSGRTAMASVATPPAARSGPMRGRAARRTTDDAIDVRSGSEGVHGEHGVFRADPHVGHGQHRGVLRAHEEGVGDVGVR